MSCDGPNGPQKGLFGISGIHHFLGVQIGKKMRIGVNYQHREMSWFDRLHGLAEGELAIKNWKGLGGVIDVSFP